MSNDTSTSSKITFAQDFILSGAAGGFAKTFTAPLERVKILLQTQNANPRMISGEVPYYTGIRNCLLRVAQEQGFLSFWRGNFTNVIRYYPVQACNFAFKDLAKNLFPRYSPKTEFGKFFLVQMGSGMIAGALSMCVGYPLEYAHTRLAADVGKNAHQRDFKGLTDCLTKTAAGPRGFTGLYSGFGVSMVSIIGIIPYRGLYFGLYDSLRVKNPYRNDQGVAGFASRFLIAQSVAIASSYCTYPLDLVIKRLQMQSMQPENQRLYRGGIDCFKKVVKNEGVTGLWKGAGAGVLRTLSSALMLVFYDQLQTMWQSEKEDVEE